MQQNTGQSEAIYIYALLAGIAGFWRFDSLAIGVLFAAVCAGVIYSAQNDYFNQAWQQIKPHFDTLYRWLLSFFQKEIEPEKTAPYVICPGQDVETRQYIVTDLNELGSFMIVGMTGSGKTSLIHSILHQLLCNSVPNELQMTIADLKEGLDFRIYRRIPHLFENLPIATTSDEAKQQIDHLLMEMSERAQLFKAIPQDRLCNNLDDYHRLGESLGLPRLCRIVAIVDEFQNLTNGSADALNGMIRLAKEGRAFGITLIPCTQIANVDVIPTALKSQMTSIFCAYLRNPSHYYKIMEIGKEQWEPFHNTGKIKGRFICDIGGEITIVQSIYVAKRELEDVARTWSENRTEPEWPKIERVKSENANPVLWAGSDDEKRAMLISWFAGFSEMPTLAEFQEKFGASQGTYYNWIPRTWDER